MVVHEVGRTLLGLLNQGSREFAGLHRRIGIAERRFRHARCGLNRLPENLHARRQVRNLGPRIDAERRRRLLVPDLQQQRLN